MAAMIDRALAPERVRGAHPDPVALAVRLAPVLLVAYLGIIAFATLLGLGFDPSLDNAAWRLRRAIAPTLGGKDYVDAARNVVLFLGWGATVVIGTRPPTSWRTIGWATATGALASLTVEALQCFGTRRMASITDVGTNTLGALLGATLLVLIEGRVRTDVRRGTLLGVPGWLATGALAAACLGLAFAPTSRPVVPLSWAGSPLARLRETLAAAPRVAGWASYAPDAAAFALLGLLAAAAAADARGRLRPPQLVAWVVLLAATVVGASALRGLAGLTADPRAFAVQLAAAAIGFGVGAAGVGRWTRAVPDPGHRNGQIAISAVATMVLWNAWPASWTATGDGLAWWSVVPMASLYLRQDLGSVFVVLQKVGVGALLGTCVAGRRASGHHRPGVRAVALVAVVVELGQLVVPGRTPDVTDVLMVVAGAATAATVALRGVAGARIDGDRVLVDPNFKPG